MIPAKSISAYYTKVPHACKSAYFGVHERAAVIARIVKRFIPDIQQEALLRVHSVDLDSLASKHGTVERAFNFGIKECAIADGGSSVRWEPFRACLNGLDIPFPERYHADGIEECSSTRSEVASRPHIGW